MCALQSLHNVLDNYQLNKQRQVANTPDDASHGNEHGQTKCFVTCTRAAAKCFTGSPLEQMRFKCIAQGHARSFTGSGFRRSDFPITGSTLTAWLPATSRASSNQIPSGNIVVTGTWIEVAKIKKLVSTNHISPFNIHNAEGPASARVLCSLGLSSHRMKPPFVATLAISRA